MDILVQVLQDFSAPMLNETNFAHESAGSWYLSPKQHVIEFFIWNILFSLMTFVYWKRIKVPKSNIPTQKKALGLPCLICLGFVIWHKYEHNDLVFLLQPCHINMLLLLVMIYSKRAGMFVLNFLLHIIWGPLLAVLFPDLRGRELFFELETFWIEHALLLITPFVLILKARIKLYPIDFNFCMFSFSLMALYHSLVLNLCALRTGKNLNYMLTPPPGPLLLLGKYYRVGTFALCLLLPFVTRITVESIVRMKKKLN